MFATVGELDPRASDQRRHRTRNHDLSRSGEGCDSGADVNGHAGDVVASDLDLARVQLRHLDPEGAHPVADRART